jgi:hypothetical protein
MKITNIDRILLLLTGLLAAWQVAIGINGADTLPTIAYTVGFGVLLIAGVLIIILGFDVLDSPIVVIISTIIPLSLSLGLIWEHLRSFGIPYSIFMIAGFLAIIVTRIVPLKNKVPVIVLASVHSIAGVTIFLVPIILVIYGFAHPIFALVSLGGALIGIGGLLLSFLRVGKPLLTRSTIFKVLPGLLLITTICFVIGFNYY